MKTKYRSTLSQRLFWCAVMSGGIATVVGLIVRPVSAGGWMWPILAGIVGAFLMAALLARAVDHRISRMREFAENLLQTDEPASGEKLDQLEALDRSLLRMASQTRGLVERAKLESARREAILSSMVEGVLAVDDQLRITFCNQALASLAGNRMPAVGTPLMELIRDATLHETLTEVIHTGEPAKRRLHIPVVSSGRSFELQAAPLITGNQPRDKPGAIAILHDITDLERLETIRNDFVANVSHEFRTPLAAISGYAETLLDGGLEDAENNRRFLEIINSNAIRLSSIAADLLTLSELQTGGGLKEVEQIPIADAIDSALSTVASEASSRGVSLERGHIDNLFVQGTRYRLEQALVNLLANGVKFNRRGGTVRAETLRNGTEVRILISDSGVGIPSTDLPRIFERFYRVDKARSRQVGGTGLGLSIVKHIVERMNGSVVASSQLGRGSVFTVTLPLS